MSIVWTLSERSLDHKVHENNSVNLVSEIVLCIWLHMYFTSHLPSQVLFRYQTQYLFLSLWTPCTFWLGIERLPARLKLLIVPSYFALDVFLKFQFERYFIPSSPEINTGCQTFQTSVPIRVSPPTLSVSTMKILKEEWQLHHDAPMQRSEDLNATDWPLQEVQPGTRTLVRIS